MPRARSSTLTRSSATFAAFVTLGLGGCLGIPCEGPAELVVDLDDSIVPASEDLRAMVRINAGHLVVGTGGAIVRRTSFSDWAPIDNPLGDAADLLGADHWGPRIIAVGTGGEVLRSDDDGASFAALDLGFTADLHAITLEAERGAIVGDDLIAYTADGGDSWAAANLPDGSFALRGVASDGAALWAVGLGGTILRSDDDGASWAMASSPSAADLWAIGYAGVDVEAGLFAVGDAGTILRLEDAGWTAVEHDLDGEFRGVGSNFIVGREGLVVAIELEAAEPGAAPQRFVELGRSSARGDLWDVVDEFAVGDGSRLTAIQTDWVSKTSRAYCDPGA